MENSIKKTTTFTGRLTNQIRYFILKFLSNRKYEVIEAKNQELLKKIYSLRYNIYCLENNYLDPNRYPNKLESDEYDNCSIHFALLTNNNSHPEVIGTVRLVKKDGGQLPIEKDFGIKLDATKFPKERILEISRLCIHQDHRKRSKNNSNALLLLIRAINLYGLQNGYIYLTAAIDKKVFNMLSKFKFSFSILGDPKYYIGSESVPVMVNLERERQWLKIMNPVVWKFINT